MSTVKGIGSNEFAVKAIDNVAIYDFLQISNWYSDLHKVIAPPHLLQECHDGILSFTHNGPDRISETSAPCCLCP